MNRPRTVSTVFSAVLWLAATLPAAGPARAQEVEPDLPAGYLVWTKGEANDAASRKLYRMTLPEQGDIVALTSGEDVEGQISPDGRWVVYAKATLSGGSEYHTFGIWSVYLVSIEGVGAGHQEIELDAEGYWPSWGDSKVIYYNKPDDNGRHAKIVRASIDDQGQVVDRQTIYETRAAFSGIREVNECVVSPDERWFAARTRGITSVTGVGAFAFDSTEFTMLARAGSIGCMPRMAPSGSWALIAGANHGIRWGEPPGVTPRAEDRLLVPPLSEELKAYHPEVSNDERWLLVSMGADWDHNASPYDVYIYPLDPQTKSAGDPRPLAQGGFNGWPDLWVGTATIERFWPSAFTVVAGESLTLDWSTDRAARVTLDGAAVEPRGQQTVIPEASRRYELVAQNDPPFDQPARAAVEIKVNAAPQAVAITRFEVEPEQVIEGEPATLSWAVENPTTLEINGTAVRPSGALRVSPSETTDYLLTAQGHQGPVSRTVTVAVGERGVGLADRGGFVCEVGDPLAGPGLAALLLLALLLVIRRKTR